MTATLAPAPPTAEEMTSMPVFMPGNPCFLNALTEWLSETGHGTIPVNLQGKSPLEILPDRKPWLARALTPITTEIHLVVCGITRQKRNDPPTYHMCFQVGQGTTLCIYFDIVRKRPESGFGTMTFVSMDPPDAEE